jgi:hypothetical protein
MQSITIMKAGPYELISSGRCLGYLEDLGENRTEAMDQAILMARADFGL